MSSAMFDLSEQVRTQLVARGLDEDLANRISAGIDIIESEEDDRDPRETIVMGYPVENRGIARMKDVAIVNMPHGGIRELLEDDVRLATFIDAGMRATPAMKRLPLPAWIIEKSREDENRRAMSRARSLAERAEDGILGEAVIGTDEPGLPF